MLAFPGKLIEGVLSEGDNANKVKSQISEQIPIDKTKDTNKRIAKYEGSAKKIL